MVVKKDIAFLMLFILHTAAANTKLWNNFVNMEDVFLSVEYHGRQLSVWKESVEGFNRFYVTPLCNLQNNSFSCSRADSPTKHRHALSFNVKIWDLNAAEKVKVALAQRRIDAQVTDISPLPMMKVRLGIKDDVTQNIDVDEEWRLNGDQPNVINFNLYTRREADCHKMKNDAQSDPTKFLKKTKLFFEFTMIPGQHQSLPLNISEQILAKVKFLNSSGITYLTPSDFNKTAHDIYRAASTQNKLISFTLSSEHVNLIISEILNVIKGKDVLNTALLNNVYIWNNVFWEDIYSRPDIQSKYFNEVLKYDKEENVFVFNNAANRKFREKIRKRHPGLIKSKGFDVSNILFNLNDQEYDDKRELFDDENVLKISYDDLQKFLKKDNINIQWSEKEFTAKEFLLHQLKPTALTLHEPFHPRIVTTIVESTQKIEIQREPSSLQAVNPVYHEEFKKQDADLKELSDNITSTFQKRYENIKQYYENSSDQYRTLSEKIERHFDDNKSLYKKIRLNLDNTTTVFHALYENIKRDLANIASQFQTRLENIERNLANQISSYNFNVSNPPNQLTFKRGSIDEGKELIITAKPKPNPKAFHFRLKRGENCLFCSRMEFRDKPKFFWNNYINERWGPRSEENKEFEYLFNEGNTFVLKLIFNYEHFNAYIDGQYIFTYNYRPSVYIDHVNAVVFSEDIIVERIEVKSSG